MAEENASAADTTPDELFALYDVNANGTISYDELATVIRGLGENPTEDELKDIFRELDRDGSGEITREEFNNYFERNPITLNPNEKQTEMRRAFETFDTDKSGFIELAEMTRILKEIGDDTMTDAEIKEVFKEFDTNGDGRLDYNEFISSMGHAA